MSNNKKDSERTDTTRVLGDKQLLASPTSHESASKRRKEDDDAHYRKRPHRDDKDDDHRRRRKYDDDDDYRRRKRHDDDDDDYRRRRKYDDDDDYRRRRHRSDSDRSSHRHDSKRHNRSPHRRRHASRDSPDRQPPSESKRDKPSSRSKPRGPSSSSSSSNQPSSKKSSSKPSRSRQSTSQPQPTSSSDPTTTIPAIAPAPALPDQQHTIATADYQQDPNGWHAYYQQDGTWDYASYYYAQQQHDPAYYQQYYDQASFDTNASFPPPPDAELAVPPPPPPLAASVEPANPVLEELGYPFPTQQETCTLFNKIGQVGEGTYGKVYKARNNITGALMALKRIRMKSDKEGFPITAMREIKLLQQLRHEHIVRLEEIMVSQGSVYMVLEYMDHDLSGILSHPEFRFNAAHIKSLTLQILQGLAYLHGMGILHRDMKGSNLLLNQQGELKIADFGLARVFRQRGDYTNRVITLWYRPPELLLGATRYDASVDIWGVGCIMMELFLGKPLFNASDEIAQLHAIYKIMGTPTLDSWPDMVYLPWYELLKPKEQCPCRFHELYSSQLSTGALALAEALLAIDPKHRPSANEALKFDYFVSEDPRPVLPANLLELKDDWHDFESKQRKRKAV
ncbi:Pkinase-domain-containing protein [Hesseltinella vesiculosa]|uniref:Pkinase-domain-containing protein n=1 Tax=Hesseltinella vesiculosa TaxID=101127 RepID=A0A1X2GIA5_9FUNG|nr:Pkinase-domain-containing protein [Hesseltinella vesiculosa]